MAKAHKDWVVAALAIKKAGNAIVTTLGGREIHPINVRVGGFYRVPRVSELRELRKPLGEALDNAAAALEWLATLDFPDFERDYELVCLKHPDEYPYNEGRLVSNKGLDIDVHHYDRWFEELHVKHSTALHSVLRGSEPYFVGPLARVSLCFDQLSDRARAAADAIGFEVPCTNPFKSLLARGIELVHALDEACQIIDGYKEPAISFVETEPRAGIGRACTEAPRGILYHRYRLDADGSIEHAKIVPPTSQNQKTIEDDLRAMAPTLAAMNLEDATWRAEQAVRNYDPCISCSTHFLKLKIEES
jgi:coenzyme F420-reducing hydrogenase alpha subunit